MNDFDTRLGDALRERVRSEQPDLSQLAAAAVRAGTRIKRRRTAGIGAGVVAGLAAAAVVAVGLPGGGTADPGREIAPAVGGTDDIAPAPDEDCLADFRVLAPGEGSAEIRERLGLTDLEGSSLGTRESQLNDLSRRLCDEPPVEDDAPVEEGKASGGGQQLPITFALDGWNCDFPADDKFPCSGPNDAWLSFVVRDAAEHDEWVGDPDKGGDANTVWVSEVHDNYFVTVLGELKGTPREDVIDGLGFAPTWER